MKEEELSCKQAEPSDPKQFIESIIKKHFDKTTGCIALICDHNSNGMDINTNNLSVEDILRSSIVFMAWGVRQFHIAAQAQDPDISLQNILDIGIDSLISYLSGPNEEQIAQDMIKEYIDQCNNTES